MDLLYSGNVEGFAIVSSDSDFTPLATRLRESGKRVIGVGRRTTPKPFVEACERFVFLEVLGGDSDATEQAAESAKDDQPRPIQSALTKALNKVDTDDEDWASLSALGDHLNRTDPSFDARSYGFGKLSDLVKAQSFIESKTVTAPGVAGSCGAAQGSSTVEDGSTRKTAVRSAKKVAKSPTKKTPRKAAPKNAARGS